MTVYRKQTGNDRWHFCTNCTNWPTSSYDQETKPENQRPSNGELCDECLGKEKNGGCNKKQ